MRFSRREGKERNGKNIQEAKDGKLKTKGAAKANLFIGGWDLLPGKEAAVVAS